MNRRELREHIFILLFRIEFNSQEEMPEQIQLYFEQLEKTENTAEEYIEKKFNAIMEKLDTLDELINHEAEGWNTTRIGKAELAIIRLAVFEIKFDDDVPTGVAINEAVELAKKYGQDESGSFVNGILAKFA